MKTLNELLLISDICVCSVLFHTVVPSVRNTIARYRTATKVQVEFKVMKRVHRSLDWNRGSFDAIVIYVNSRGERWLSLYARRWVLFRGRWWVAPSVPRNHRSAAAREPTPFHFLALSLSLSFTAQVYYPRKAKNTETPKTDVKIALGVTESEGLRANRALKEGLRAK